MDNDFNTAKAVFGKVIQKCIDMKWIKLNKYISVDGVAIQFANELSDMQREKQGREIMGQLIWLKANHPDTFEVIKSLFADK